MREKFFSAGVCSTASGRLLRARMRARKRASFWGSLATPAASAHQRQAGSCDNAASGSLASQDGRGRTIHPGVSNLLGHGRPVADGGQVLQQRLNILVKGGRVDGGARKGFAQAVKDVCHLQR